MRSTDDRIKTTSNLPLMQEETDSKAFVPSEKVKNLWQKAYKKLRMQMRIKRMLAGAKQEPELVFDEALKKFVSAKIFNPYFVEVKPQGGRFVLSPQGPLYSIWLTFVSLILLYLAIGDPFISAFCDLDTEPNLLRLDIVMDIVFITDFCVTLNLAFYDEDGSMVKDRKRIFGNYLKGWMLIDVFSCVPFGIIDAFAGNSSSNANLVRLVRLRNIPRLLRLAKLMKIVSTITMFEDLDYIISKYNKELRFIKVMFGVCICIHLTACLFYLCAKINNFGPGTWVYAQYPFGDFYGDSIGEKYVTCLYWAITTLATIGYGDIVPISVYERLLAMVWMIIGVYVVSYSVGSLTSFYSDINIKETLKHERIVMAEDFSKKVGIPKPVLYKVKRTIKSMDISTTTLEQDRMFQGVPLQLKIQITKNIFHAGIERIPFFTNKDVTFMADIALRLEHVYGSEEEVIWIEKESADGIYFIIEGRVRLSHLGTVFNMMQIGYYFGDIEMVNGTERFFKVESCEGYRFLKMGIEVIERIQEIYPLVWKEIKDSSKRRLRNQIQNLAEMLIIKRVNNTGSIHDINLAEFKTELSEIYERLHLEAQNSEKKDFKMKLKNRLEGTAKSISRISDMVDILFK